jgi:hypothetical protein
MCTEEDDHNVLQIQQDKAQRTWTQKCTVNNSVYNVSQNDTGWKDYSIVHTTSNTKNQPNPNTNPTKDSTLQRNTNLMQLSISTTVR